MQTAASIPNTSGDVKLTMLVTDKITLKTSVQDMDLLEISAELDDIDKDLFPAQRALHFIASSSGLFTVSGTLSTGTSAWTQLTDKTGTVVLSQTPGGTIRQTTATGSSGRSATWNFTGLSPGYYRVEILYPRSNENATCVQVLTKSTKDTIFIARKNRLNQQLGTQVTTVSTGYINTSTDVTLLPDGKTPDYILVDSVSTGRSGTLSVRLSDSGVGASGTGCKVGRIVADTVRLTGVTIIRTNR